MQIRKTTLTDLPQVMQIYTFAQKNMVDSGNTNQWHIGYPPQKIIEADINAGLSYVCTDGANILAVFFFDTKPDPTYTEIDGAWKNDLPYGVVHRIARAKDANGAGEFCLKWCLQQTPSVRIDTHKDNAPMLKLLQKLGFEYCGIIWLANGDERLAFQI